MEEKPRVKLSTEIGRGFMMAEQPWFDIDMCQSSHELTAPAKNAHPMEAVKYTICRHALNTYKERQLVLTPDQLVEHMWFTYAMLPCHFVFDDVAYVALVSLRGICWVSRAPVAVLDVDGPHYAQLMTLTDGVRENIRTIIRQM